MEYVFPYEQRLIRGIHEAGAFSIYHNCGRARVLSDLRRNGHDPLGNGIPATRGIVRIGKPGGRYLFAASDFLEKNTPIDNVNAMLTTAADEGSY